MPLVPDHIKKLQPYKPGKSIDELKRELGVERIVKLASNENPIGVSPLAFQAMQESLLFINRYPNPDIYELRKALAERYDVKIGNVFAGNGSEGIIAIIMRTFLLDDEEAITSHGSFVTFDVQAQSRGIKLIRTPLKEYKIDLQAMAERITPKTKLIYLANPNNPTGTIFTVSEFLKFINEVPPRVLVILDEAYFEFAHEEPTYPDSMQYRLDNVITLRTFSKAFGLAGVRIGYGFAHETLIENLMKIKLTFEPSVPAQAAAIAALNDEDFLEKTLHNNRVGKRFFYQLFDQLGLRYIKSFTNFVTLVFDSEKQVNTVFNRLLREGVIVRPLKSFGLPNCLRVSIGLPEENEFFAEKLKKVL